MILFLYLLPGALLFIINVAFFTHTAEIEKLIRVDLSDVWNIKHTLNNIPHENQFIAACVMTTITAAVCIGCLFLWPLFVLLTFLSKD